MLNPLRTAFHHNASTLCECVRACDSGVVQCWILSLLFSIHFAFFVIGVHSHSDSRRLVLLLCVPSRVCMGACVCIRHLIFHSLYLLYVSYIVYRVYATLLYVCYCMVAKRDVLLYTCDVYMRAQSNNNYKRARSFSFVRSLIVAGYYCTLAIFHCSFLLPSFFSLFNAGIEQLFARELLQFSFVLCLDFDAHTYTGDQRRYTHNFAHLSYLFVCFFLIHNIEPQKKNSMKNCVRQILLIWLFCSS